MIPVEFFGFNLQEFLVLAGAPNGVTNRVRGATLCACVCVCVCGTFVGGGTGAFGGATHAAAKRLRRQV